MAFSRDIPEAIARAGTRHGRTAPADSRIKGISLRDHEEYVSLTMEFRCNLRCVHCMIEDTMDRLETTPDAVLDRVCAEQSRTGRWKGLVLTGSEITLRRDLDRIALKARRAGFARVRIQTHGMHLGRTEYADRLIDAGIDEFFVSVAGSDSETHDAITQVPGSWDKMMDGLAHLDSHDHVRILTNSVVTKRSYTLLPGMVRALSHLRRLVQMEFWNYFPMSERDEKDLLARNADILPYLREAILAARAEGRFVEVKNFPECLLADLGDALVNAQPTLVIDPAFWREFDRNEFRLCPHQARCDSQECLGLTRAYVEKFGEDADILDPFGLSVPK